MRFISSLGMILMFMHVQIMGQPANFRDHQMQSVPTCGCLKLCQILYPACILIPLMRYGYLRLSLTNSELCYPKIVLGHERQMDKLSSLQFWKLNSQYYQRGLFLKSRYISLPSAGVAYLVVNLRHNHSP